VDSSVGLHGGHREERTETATRGEGAYRRFVDRVYYIPLHYLKVYEHLQSPGVIES
jgi:hypothetical protein